VLVGLLNSPDTDVQYYCTTALSNIAVDGPSVHVIVFMVEPFRSLLMSQIGFFRFKQEKTGTKRTEVGDKLGSAHGQHKFEGTMPGGAGITESCE
jgi:hypothetical protein